MLNLAPLNLLKSSENEDDDGVDGTTLDDNPTQVWHWLFLFSSFLHLGESVAASELFQFTVIILLLFTVLLCWK